MKTKMAFLVLLASLYFVTTVTANTGALQVRQSLSNSPIERSSNKSLEHSLNFITTSGNYTEGQDDLTLVMLSFNPKFKFNVSENFYIDVDTLMNLNSARSQSRYIPFQNNQFVLNELSANYTLFNSIRLAGGSINQKHLHAPLLIFEISFPGAAIFAEKKIGQYLSLGAKSQRLIPTSSSFDSQRTEEEETPSFITNGIFLKYDKDDTKAMAQVNYYSFSSLPSIVAFRSKRLGNTVTGIEEGDSQFVFDFSGYSQSYYIQVPFNRNIDVAIDASIIENQNAPAGNNRAQMLKAALNLKNGKYNIVPSLGRFYAEPDVTPGFYNTPILGNNNRSGMIYSLRVENTRLNFAAQLNYIDAQTINNSAFQNDRIATEILVEMLNVKF